MDTAQTILLFVIIALTVLLLILGIQVFFILKEFKQTVTKVNKVLDDTGLITESVSRPVSAFSSLLTGVKAGTSLISFFNKKKKTIRDFMNDEEEENE